MAAIMDFEIMGKTSAVSEHPDHLAPANLVLHYFRYKMAANDGFQVKHEMDLEHIENKNNFLIISDTRWLQFFLFFFKLIDMPL